jgi:hypothetical protein
MNWSNIVNGIDDDSTNKTLTVNPVGNSFYRLFRP